ncbi:MAG: SpoIIE family protein phosphatase [Rhodospirillales bacterium]
MSSTTHAVTVLLVDDQPIVAEAVRRMLASEPDIAFFYCQEPAQAIPTALEVRPTVVLQDLVMPDVDGLTLTRFFRGHPKLKNVPLIVLSSKEEPTTKAQAFGCGANDYLVKLPDKIELIARIRHHSQGYINLLERNEAHQKLLESQQALAAELNSAAQYVMSLLPKPLTEGPVRTLWRYAPSAQLGGDAFGYHWLDENNFAVYLLDVCGHGVASALLSVSALNTLRSQSANCDFRDAGAVLSAVNDAFPMQKHNNLFFTLWYGVYHVPSRTMRYANAGHPPPLLVSSAGAVERLSFGNPGAFPGVKYASASVEIPPGSRLYIYSDGVYEVESPDGAMWDLDSLQAFLACPRENELEALHLKMQQLRGAEVLEDDFSILKVTPE